MKGCTTFPSLVGICTHVSSGAPGGILKMLNRERWIFCGCRPADPAAAGPDMPAAPCMCAPNAYSWTFFAEISPLHQSRFKLWYKGILLSSVSSFAAGAAATRCRTLRLLDPPGVSPASAAPDELAAASPKIRLRMPRLPITHKQASPEQHKPQRRTT